jgi:hypothetical protein
VNPAPRPTTGGCRRSRRVRWQQSAGPAVVVVLSGYGGGGGDERLAVFVVLRERGVSADGVPQRAAPDVALWRRESGSGSLDPAVGVAGREAKEHGRAWRAPLHLAAAALPWRVEFAEPAVRSQVRQWRWVDAAGARRRGGERRKAGCCSWRAGRRWGATAWRGTWERQELPAPAGGDGMSCPDSAAIRLTGRCCGCVGGRAGPGAAAPARRRPGVCDQSRARIGG